MAFEYCEVHLVEHKIDLDGPAGNAFSLLATARGLAERSGFTKEEIETMHDQMMDGNYFHLLAIFEEYWGEQVTLTTSHEYTRDGFMEVLNARRYNTTAEQGRTEDSNTGS